MSTTSDDDQARFTDGTLEVVRHEEELRTSTVAEPYGRVRISKRVVTETVTVEVTLRREELVVEHLPLDAPRAPAAPGAPSRAGRLKDAALARLASRRSERQIDEETVELELLEERYEVVKRVVPRERVRLRRTVTSTQAPVSGQVRKEVVDVLQEVVDAPER